MLSLQSLSFNIIINNFQRIHFAFTVSNDARLQRGMKFLQRRFSNELARKLLSHSNAPEYTDFVINECLNIVDIQWFKNISHSYSVDDFFCRLPNLTKLIMKYEGDEIFQSVAKFCPRIVEIDTCHSNITDKGLQYLCEANNGRLACPELRRIRKFWTNSVTHEGAEYLIRNLPLIEKFDYIDLPLVLHSIHTRNISQHQELLYFNLTELNLERCVSDSYVQKFNLTEVLKSCLAVCPKLETLFCKLLEKEQLDVIANSHLHLKKLYVWFYDTLSNIYSCRVLTAFGRSLTTLSICNCKLRSHTILLPCPMLEYFAKIAVDFKDNDDADELQRNLPSSTELKYPIVVKVLCLHLTESNFDSCIYLSRKIKQKILLWCRSPIAKHIVFLNVYFQIDFLRNCLLNCHSLVSMTLFACKYDVENPYEILSIFAESLPNKPKIIFKEE